MTRPRGVDREFYDEMRGRAERAEAELAQYRLLYGKLVDTVVEMKRHEQGMHPAGFDPEALDPVNKLGPKTRAAIEEYSHSDPELVNYHRNFALMEWAARPDVPDDEKDDLIAKRIAEGDA